MRELTPETITDAVLDQMATTPARRLTKRIGAQKAIVTNAWSLMRRIHPHGRNKRCRAHGAADVPSDNKPTSFLAAHETPKRL